MYFTTVKKHNSVSQMKTCSFQANYDPDTSDSVYFSAFTYYHIPGDGDQSYLLQPEIYQLLAKSMQGKGSTL